MNDLNQLLQRVRDGEPSAGPVLVSVYGRGLAQYLATIAPQLSDVDREMLAERSIETAVAGVDRFDPQLASFDAWLRGFGRRKLMEHFRTNPNMVPQPTEHDFGAAGVTPPTESSDIDVAHLKSLAKAMGMLSPTDQLIISLRDVNGLSYEDIGSQLKRTAAACRQRHKRALANLRVALEQVFSQANDTTGVESPAPAQPPRTTTSIEGSGESR